MPDSNVIIFGGASNERRVSVATAQSVAGSLSHESLWFITPSGSVQQVDLKELLGHASPFENDFKPNEGKIIGSNLDEALSSVAGDDCIFFLALHGGDGENGVAQSTLEAYGLPFTGSGSAASAIAFNKLQAKDCVRQKGLRTSPSIVLASRDPNTTRAHLTDFLRRNGAIMVKPVADGSSVNVFKIDNEVDLERVVGHITTAKGRYFAEVFVRGREITIGVIDDGTRVRALPASEVRMQNGRFFDFAGKYLGQGSVEITPAHIPDEMLRQIQNIAVDAHTAIGCEGYSRTDIIIDERDGQPVYLETNTLPGLTKASFVPQQLRADGTSFRDFLGQQVELARSRSLYEPPISHRHPVKRKEALLHGRTADHAP